MCNRILRAKLVSKDRKKIEKIETAFGVEVIEAVHSDSGIQPTLINGQPVDREDWPEVVRIQTSGGCTATLVGSNCAITAAHCGDDGQTGRLELFDGSSVRFTVIQMPQYNSPNHDLSVLRLHDSVDVPFAEVGLDHVFTNGQSILLAGYGCTTSSGTGGNDGILRIGPSRVVGHSGTDVVTQWIEQNGAALCYGDSGGPMFTREASAGNRVLVAVNSKGNIRDTNYNMQLNLPEVRTFLEGVADRYDLEINGINGPGPGGGGCGENAKELLRKLLDELKDVNEKANELHAVIGSD